MTSSVRDLFKSIAPTEHLISLSLAQKHFQEATSFDINIIGIFFGYLETRL